MGLNRAEDLAREARRHAALEALALRDKERGQTGLSHPARRADIARECREAPEKVDPKDGWHHHNHSKRSTVAKVVRAHRIRAAEVPLDASYSIYQEAERDRISQINLELITGSSQRRTIQEQAI